MLNSMKKKKNEKRKAMAQELFLFGIFSEDEIFIQNTETGMEKSIKYGFLDRLIYLSYDDAIFFEITKGRLYLMIGPESILCIHSKNGFLGAKDKPREERIKDIESISLDILLEIAPKEKARKIAFNLDFFMEHTIVADL